MPYPRRRRPPWIWISVGLGVALVALLVIVLVLRVGAGPGYAPPFVLLGGLSLTFLMLWIVFAVVRIAFWSSRARHRRMAGGRPGPQYPAVRIVRERYARGEITREQYEQFLSDLLRRESPPPLP